MKRCPSCQRTFTDDSLGFCLEDGSPLVGASIQPDLPATVIMQDPRATNQGRSAGAYPTNPATAPPYSMPPQPGWPPPATQPQHAPAAAAGAGRAIGIISLIAAILAFILLILTFVLAASNDVDKSTVGGIFLFSLLVGLVGAVLGLIALIKSNRNPSAQANRGLSIVALVLNVLYLLITFTILIFGVVANS
ncbi:MAG TPA: hypothetical protein VF723_15415 [Pyrinomonadaceae bacterium]|jgi:hypothetical protein